MNHSTGTTPPKQFTIELQRCDGFVAGLCRELGIANFAKDEEKAADAVKGLALTNSKIVLKKQKSNRELVSKEEKLIAPWAELLVRFQSRISDFFTTVVR